MKAAPIRLTALVALSVSTAPAGWAQLSVARPAPPKLPATSPNVPPGGFLVGSDDCNAPHRAIGTGEQLGVPFVTGTTGSEGQTETGCYAFGSSGIDNDVWFDWTASASGVALISLCTGTSVDTKVAVWPGAAGCPADGTSLACNDDACGLQSRVTWGVVAGNTYTIQLGTFPGAAGGSGTFDVLESLPMPCGTHDDGVSENALGLIAGGETGWLHFDDCTYDLHAIETAYGSPLGTSPPNGAASRIALYEDPDCDGNPTTGPLALEFSIATMVTNAGTDVLNRHPVACPVDYAGTCLWVLATADQAPGEFPGPMDETNPYDGAWVVGNTAGPGTLDIQDLTNNSVPPLEMSAAGFPAAWLLRIDGGGGDTFYGIACESGCDGTPCPCGNDGDFDEGCVNSTGRGAILWAQSTASISQDDFALQAVQIPDQPGIFFQGDTYLANEPVFGAGIRCCGENVVRWITVMAQGGCASTDQPSGCGTQIGGVGGSIVALAGLSAGDTRCYQYWYRDPSGGPCPGAAFNLTPGVIVTWAP